MVAAVSAADTKVRIDELLAEMDEHGGENVRESQGKPRAVLMSVTVYEEVQALRERQRRADTERLLDEQRRAEGMERLR